MNDFWMGNAMLSPDVCEVIVCDFVGCIGHSQLSSRLLKVPWKQCLVNDLKFLDGVILLLVEISRQ